MKRIQYIFTTILLLILLFIGETEASAVNTFFPTQSLPENDRKTLLENVNISMLADEPPQKAIKCFSVNEDGLIAIGCGNSENKTVCIYTNDGVFKYGYSFKCSGSFGIELDKSVLNIYLVRSDVAIAVNSTGEVEGVLKIQNTSENNAYWNNCVFSTKREIGDTEYFLKNDMGIFNLFASSYSQLIVTNKNGEESIIYDVNSTHFSNVALAVAVVTMFICLAGAVVIWHFIKLKRNA